MNIRNIPFCLLLATCLSVVSCDLSGSGRKVVEGLNGVKETAERIESTARAVNDLIDAVENTSYDDDDNSSRQGVDQLLLPAPLTNTDEQILYRTGYVTSYNKANKIPNWVAWHLTKAHTYGKSSRQGMEFTEDNDVPSPRADFWDYYNSGYDRGHMCPAADNKWSDEAMNESFLMTNICPQNNSLNAGDWNEMEIQCRNWARRYGSVYVICGPILYKGVHKRIGKHKVVVPEAFFKVVMRMGKNPKAIAFAYKNRSGNRPKGDYVNTVDEMERITGIDFFPSLPDDIEEKMEAEADLSDWGL